MLSPDRSHRSPQARHAQRIALEFPLVRAGLVTLATLASCGSRPAADPARGSADGALAPHGAQATKARAREQDILAALPLARRVPRIIRSRDGRQVFMFEGYYSGR